MKKVNEKEGFCENCCGLIEAKKGYLMHEYDDNNDRMEWKVFHVDYEICKKVKEENKKRKEEEKRIRNERIDRKIAAKKSLKSMIENGIYPEGSQNKPQGTYHAIGDDMVVIEPDQKYFWLISYGTNSGNIGGGNACGYRIPMTAEVTNLIEIIQQNS